MSSTALILSLTIGLPMFLLAVGVLWHAYVLGRQPADFDDLDTLGAHVEALATESTDALLVDLTEAVERMQGQLARQRESLADSLSDEARKPRGMAGMTPAFAMAPAPAAPMAPIAPVMMPQTQMEPERAPLASGAPVSTPRAMGAMDFTTNDRMPGQPIEGQPGGLAASVSRLVSEGLSDRAIARQLHIGLEEVRMTRMRSAR